MCCVTLEAMYKLEQSGGQQWHALRADIADDFLIKDVFEGTPDLVTVSAP